MTWFEVLLEGESDVPAVREILTRRFGLVENQNFRLHPHRGKGSLPTRPLSAPDPRQQTLLHQLPAKLRGLSFLGGHACVLVLLDVDRDSCSELLAGLQKMLSQLPKRPERVLFRLAIEETESWFIAEPSAIRKAFPRAKTNQIAQIEPDSIVGAWEQLARALDISPDKVAGVDKLNWAERISPHLDLAAPRSPSLRKFIQGVARTISECQAHEAERV